MSYAFSMHVCVCGYTYALVCMWLSKDNLGHWFSPPTMWVVELDFGTWQQAPVPSEPSCQPYSQQSHEKTLSIHHHLRLNKVRNIYLSEGPCFPSRMIKLYLRRLHSLM